MPPVRVVVAATPSWGIGKDNTLPWSIPKDMLFFRRQTSHVSDPARRNAVVMGRKTWRSIPAKHRPLPGRVNIVITASPDARTVDGIPGDVHVVPSFDAALKVVNEKHADDVETVYAIGGARVFEDALRCADTDIVYLTRVLSDVECDVSMPPLATDTFVCEKEEPIEEENGVRFQFTVYKRAGSRTLGSASGSTATATPTATAGAGACPAEFVADGGATGAADDAVDAVVRSSRPTPMAALAAPTEPHEELQYLNLIRDIIRTGVRRGDRTGTGTLSKFGVQMRFSLRDNVFPLLTTKKVFWRGVAEELLWFISGDTNAGTLQDKNIHIWDGNGSREFLDKCGLSHREEGDLGPVYGFQWRHFGAKYTDMHADYTGKGVDQLATVINTIKTNPNDRRIIMSAWNPSDLKAMALPPCHMFCQFYVADGELSCQMYQRSADMGLGVPFNIASYALLTRLIAQVCGLKAGDFIHTIGDCHVYLNHVEPLRVQLEREPRPFPSLHIDPSITDIDEFRYTHLKVEGYDPWPPVAMKMAV